MKQLRRIFEKASRENVSRIFSSRMHRLQLICSSIFGSSIGFLIAEPSLFSLAVFLCGALLVRMVFVFIINRPHLEGNETRVLNWGQDPACLKPVGKRYALQENALIFILMTIASCITYFVYSGALPAIALLYAGVFGAPAFIGCVLASSNPPAKKGKSLIGRLHHQARKPKNDGGENDKLLIETL